jgi:hypothetical protein
MQSPVVTILTEEFITQFLHLTTTNKAKLLHICADEFMTVDDFNKLTKMPMRTIYAKFGTEEVKGFEFCGHKLIHM